MFSSSHTWVDTKLVLLFLKLFVGFPKSVIFLLDPREYKEAYPRGLKWKFRKLFTPEKVTFWIQKSPNWKVPNLRFWLQNGTFSGLRRPQSSDNFFRMFLHKKLIKSKPAISRGVWRKSSRTLGKPMEGQTGWLGNRWIAEENFSFYKKNGGVGCFFAFGWKQIFKKHTMIHRIIWQKHLVRSDDKIWAPDQPAALKELALNHFVASTSQKAVGILRGTHRLFGWF